MPSFSSNSLKRLKTCHKDLQMLFEEVVKDYDCTIICGHRDKEAQNSAFVGGRSKLKYPHSKHNIYPSIAVDVAPYPIEWKNLKRFYVFGGYVIATARMLQEEGRISYGLRWGGDWDGDKVYNDQKFIDLPHFELI